MIFLDETSLFGEIFQIFSCYSKFYIFFYGTNCLRLEANHLTWMEIEIDSYVGEQPLNAGQLWKFYYKKYYKLEHKFDIFVLVSIFVVSYHLWQMFQVAIVVGGGNIFRGSSWAGSSGLDRSSADYIG